jgi:hypothetical protein
MDLRLRFETRTIRVYVTLGYSVIEIISLLSASCHDAQFLRKRADAIFYTCIAVHKYDE